MKPRVLAARLAPPLCAFLAVRVGLALVAVSERRDPLGSAAWHRWDSALYVGIAEHGYDLVECAKIGYARSGWCGNAGWMPGYPLLIAGLVRLGLPAITAGAILSGLFAAASLCLVWLVFLDGRPTRANLVTLALAAFFPGAVYQHAVFPISMLTLAALGSLALSTRDRPLASGLCGAAGAFSYSTGFLLAPVAALATLLSGPAPRALRIRRAAASSLPILAGGGAVLLVHHLTVGAWDAFFRVQAKYGHGAHSPLDTLWRTLAPLRDGLPDRAREIPALQTLLVALASLAMLGASLRRDRPAEPHLPWLRAYLAAFWLFPLVMGSGVALYRAEALLMPAALLARRLPFAAQCALLALSAPLALAIGALFFRGVLA